MVYFKDDERKNIILRGRKRKRAKRQSSLVDNVGDEKQLYWKSANGEVVEQSLDKQQQQANPKSFRENAQKARRDYAEEFERLESSKMEIGRDFMSSSKNGYPTASCTDDEKAGKRNEKIGTPKSNAHLRTSESALLQELGQLRVEKERLGKTIEEQRLKLRKSKKIEVEQAEMIRRLSESIEKSMAEKRNVEKAYHSVLGHGEEVTEFEKELALRVTELEDRDASIASLRIQNSQADETLTKLKTELAIGKREREDESEKYAEERKLMTNCLNKTKQQLLAAEEETRRLDLHAKNLESQLASLETQRTKDEEKNNDKLGTLTGEIENLKASRDEWKCKSMHLSVEVELLMAKISKFQVAHSELEKELVECRAELEHSRKQQGKFDLTNEKLKLSRSEVSCLENKIERINAEKACIEAKAERSNADLQSSIRTLDELKSKLSDAEAETNKKIFHLISKLTSMEKEKLDNCKRITELKTSSDELQHSKNLLEEMVEELRAELEAEKATTATNRKLHQIALSEIETDRSGLLEKLAQALRELDCVNRELHQNQSNYQKLKDHSNSAIRKFELEMATLKDKLEGATRDVQSLGPSALDCKEKSQSERHADAGKDRKLRQDLTNGERIAGDCRNEAEESCIDLDRLQGKTSFPQKANGQGVAMRALLPVDEVQPSKEENNMLRRQLGGMVSSEAQIVHSSQGEAETQSDIDRNIKKAVDKAVMIVQLANSDIDMTNNVLEEADKLPITSKLNQDDDARPQAKPSLYGHLPENQKPDCVPPSQSTDRLAAQKVTYDGKILCFRETGKQTITIYSDSEDERTSR